MDRSIKPTPVIEASLPRGNGKPARAHRFVGINWLLGVVLALVSTCSAAPTHRYNNGVAREIPGYQLRSEDEIDGFDVLLDGSGDLHVAWSVTTRAARRTPVSRQVWYRLRTARTGTWSDPVMIFERPSHFGIGTIRIRRLGDELHIVSGERLEHFVSSSRGWTKLPPLDLPYPVMGFDVLSDSASLLIAYSLPKPDERDPTQDGMRLCIRRLGAQESSAAFCIAEYESTSSHQANPLLVRTAEGASLYYAVNQQHAVVVHVGDRDIRGSGEGATIYTSRLVTPSRTWTAPRLVASTGDEGGEILRKGSGPISGLEIAKLGSRTILFYCAADVYQVGTDGTEPMGADRRVAPATNHRGWAPKYSLVAVSNGERGYLLWIDTRFQHTDQNLEQRMFGDPQWADNDVMCLPIPEGLSGGSGLLRLTSEFTYAGQLRAVAHGDSVLALWTGIDVVGKTKETLNRPTVMYLAGLRLPSP